jgi:uncharacterized protein (TIGR02246 family)
LRTLAVLALSFAVSAHAGEVTVIRPTAFIGAEATYYIALDGRPLRDIETRQHVRFDVPNGRHTLAVRCPKSLSLQYAETRVEEELGPAPAFFVIEPKFDCVTISRIAAAAAAPLIGNSTLRTDSGTTYAQGKVQPSAGIETREAAPAPRDVTPELDNPTAAWLDAFNSGDAARIASLYDAQAVLIGTDAKQPVAGAAAITAYFRQAAGNAARVAQGEHTMRAYGDMAIDSGLYNFFFVREGKALLVPARYTFVYRKRDGKWLIVEHHSSRVP